MNQATGKLAVTERPMTAAEKRRLEDGEESVPDDAEDPPHVEGGPEVDDSDADDGAEEDDGEPAGEPVEDQSIPDWVVLPPGLKLPRGQQVIFARFRAAWTDAPHKGERQCVMWNLSVADEKLALGRSRGDSLRTIDELTKQAVRVVDGQLVDWSRGPGQANRFWNEVGAKCRQQLKNQYARTHSFTPEEVVDFFTSCVAVRTVAT